jgi:hypothetical protein
MKGSYKDVNIKIQQNIAKDNSDKVIMIEETILTTTYQVTIIIGQIQAAKDSKKSKLEIREMINPLIIKKQKLITAKKSLKLQKKIFANKAENAKKAAHRIVDRKITKVYAAEGIISKKIADKTKALKKKIAHSKAIVQDLEAKVLGASSLVEKKILTKELAKSKKAHTRFVTVTKMEMTTIESTTISEETSKIMKPEISKNKLKWAVKKLSPATALKIVAKVSSDLHLTNKLISRELKKASRLTESLGKFF